MRIVGGRFRGRPLVPPKHDGVRPTADRVRESLFNILEHGIENFALQGARVLDLFAGTGAMGLEAVSRGAARAIFVETDPNARGVIQANIAAFGLGGAAKILRRSALDLGADGAREQFDLVFADPPYGQGLGQKAFANAASHGWLKADAVTVLEEAASADADLPDGFEQVDRRKYGNSQIVIGRWRDATT